MTNAPDDLDTLRSNLGRALAILDAKHDGYVEAREYYDGTHAEVFASKAVRRLLASAAEAVPISLAHIPVDVIADKIKLVSLTATEPDAAAVLDTVTERNDLDDEADDMILKACYYGDYYAIVDPEVETEEGIDVDGIGIVGSSPLNTVMVYDPKDGRTAIYGAKVWRDGKRWRALLFYHDCTVKLITDDLADDADPRAELFMPDLAPDELEADRPHYLEHPGERLLLAHLAIDGKPYGVPVHRKAWGPQDAITKVSATNG